MELNERGRLLELSGEQAPGQWRTGTADADLAGPVIAGTVGSAFSVAAILMSWHTIPYPRWVAVPAQCAGLLFLAAGLFLWTRRPGAARMARLLVAMGVTWYFGDLQFSGHPLLAKAGFWLFYLNTVVLAHLLLAYPDGRLIRRAERRTVFALYAVVLSTQGLRTLTEHPLQPQMAGDPDAKYSVWAPVGSVLAIALAVVVVVLVVQRWRSEPPPARRERGLFWAAVAFIGTVFAAGSAAAVAKAPARLHATMLLAYTFSLLVLGIAVLLGSLHSQMAHQGVSRMLARLSEDGSSMLQQKLADTLEDPTLTLHYRRVDSDVYVDERGLPSPLPTGEGRAMTVVGPQEKPLAVLAHDPFLVAHPRHRERLQAVVEAARLALDNQRLHAENRAKALGIMEAELATRNRISRALHDGSQHRLSRIQYLVGQAIRHHDGTSATAELHTIAEALQEAVNDLREVTEGIYPSALSRGLADALDPLAQHSPIPLTIEVVPRRWPAPVEEAAFFIISEAVGNAHKHAAATRITVRVRESEGRAVLEVHDDGRGGATARPGGRGLQSMHDRAAVHGGTLTIDSPPRGGTTLRVVLPCV
ncbi:sensor histidine kinase [Streptomyces melanogenes]|uniref:sensor histidine kinase n=1 Tax=Streptomyces melanogenes TaxID=67326 RepID=UPI0037A7858F